MSKVVDILQAGDKRVLFVDEPFDFKVNDSVLINGVLFHAFPGSKLKDAVGIKCDNIGDYEDGFFIGSRVSLT